MVHQNTDIYDHRKESRRNSRLFNHQSYHLYQHRCHEVHHCHRSCYLLSKSATTILFIFVLVSVTNTKWSATTGIVNAVMHPVTTTAIKNKNVGEKHHPNDVNAIDDARVYC